MKFILKFALCLCCVAFWCNVDCQAQTLSATFEKISHLEGFEEPNYTAEEYGFPKEMGDMKMTVYKNADPRDKVLEILASIPQGLLEIDYTNHKGKITRHYLEKDNDGNSFMLQIFIGTGGNDLVAWLFTGASHEYYQEIIQRIRASIESQN